MECHLNFTLPSLLAAACFAPLAVGGGLDEEPVQVYLLVGQSNMQGKGKIEHLRELAADEDPYSRWLGDDGAWHVRSDVSIWYMGATGGLAPGYGTPTDRFGPELGIGEVLGEASAAHVLLVKIAWGGKSLAVDFRPPSAGDVGPYYGETLEHARDVLANTGKLFPALAGREAELAGLFWFQGWNDRVNQDFNDEYEENLAHLIRDLRRDLGTPELPVVIGETGQGGPLETHPRAVSLMRAQAAVAAREEFRGNVVLVETKEFYDDEPRHDGGYHFFGNARNFYRIGDALGEAMVELVGLDSRRRFALSSLLAIEEAAQLFAIRNAGRYPDDLEDLVRPDANGASFLKRNSVPLDPWGQEYVYAPPTPGGPLEILSLGADGKRGGAGASADVTLLESHAR